MTVGIEELFSLAVHNLLRAKARLVMTAGGVLVGTAAVTLLIGLTFGLQTAAEAGVGQSSTLRDVEVYPNFNFSQLDAANSPQLTPAAIRGFWDIDGVQAVFPMIFLQGGTFTLDELYGGGQIIGLDERLLPYMELQTTDGELSFENGGVIIGSEIEKSFYDIEAEVYEPITVDLFADPPTLTLNDVNGTTRETSVRINARLASGGRFDYAIFMSLDDVLDYNSWITGQTFNPETFVFDQVIVRATGRETAKAVSEAVKALGYSVSGAGEYLAQINGLFAIMRLVLGGVGGIALLVSAFGVANTMTMAILERTREIGLMKAVGARNQDILVIFMFEAGLIGLIGGGTGLTVSYAAGYIINDMLVNASTSTEVMGMLGSFGVNLAQAGAGIVLITPELALLALASATGVGLAAGVLPALRAARMLTTTALRTE